MESNAISFNPQDILTVHDNQIRTSSLKVAEVFGKRHDNIIAKIKSLDCSPEFNHLNFKEIPVDVALGHNRTRKSTAYEMTKDGFMFLVMGFTGKKAAAIKEAYINAFNWMAEQLQQQYQPPQQQITSIPTYQLPQLPPHQVVVNRQDLANLLTLTGMTRERWREMERAREALDHAQNTMRQAIGQLHDAVTDTAFHEAPLRRSL